MTTVYYVNYQIRKSNGAYAWLRSKYFENETEARHYYQGQIEKRHVFDARVFRKDHYQPEEMKRPDYHPNGFDSYFVVCAYSRV